MVYKLTARQEGSIDVGITWQRRFNSPLFAIDYLDMTRDGLCEIVVACLSGVHMLQVHRQHWIINTPVFRNVVLLEIVKCKKE